MKIWARMFERIHTFNAGFHTLYTFQILHTISYDQLLLNDNLRVRVGCTDKKVCAEYSVCSDNGGDVIKRYYMTSDAILRHQMTNADTLCLIFQE